MDPALRRKNRRILLGALTAAAIMVGASFAAVPLYDLFCRVTGFGGTTQMSSQAPDPSAIIDRTVSVRFNTDTGRNMPWRFKADQRQVVVKLGQPALISFSVKNPTAAPVAGTALYNVSPAKAGKYFHKTQCFCFDEQIMQPGQDATMPVVFFIDPAMNDDPNLEDVRVITLSYTYFRANSPELDAAWETFLESSPPATASPLAGTVALTPEKQ